MVIIQEGEWGIDDDGDDDVLQSKTSYTEKFMQLRTNLQLVNTEIFVCVPTKCVHT